MPTTNYAIPTYTTSDTAALDTLLNGQANAIDTAILSTEGYTIGTDAQRVALTAPRRKEGLEWYSTDTNLRWFYDGTTWISAEPGVYLIRPTSVVNGTIVGAGRVDFTTVATVSVNGVFSSRFTNYRLILHGRNASASNAIQLRLRASGTDAITNYESQRHFNSTASALSTQRDPSGSIWTLSAQPGLRHRASFDLFDPFESRPSVLLGNVVTMGGAVTPGLGVFGGEHTTASAYDGFTFFIGAGTFDGTLSVYGMA